MNSSVNDPGRPRLGDIAGVGLVLLGLVTVAAVPARGQVKEDRRLASCQEVLEELLAGEESIPRDLLDKAECVAIVPSVKKFALGFGGRYGKGRCCAGRPRAGGDRLS